jgi:hypothetical protein
MIKYLVAVILIAGAYLMLFFSLLSTPNSLYKHNRELSVSLYSNNTPDIIRQIEKIKNNPDWLSHVKRHAKIRGITIPLMLEKSAKSFLKEHGSVGIKKNNVELDDLTIEKRDRIRKRILKDSLWLESIKKQAKERGISDEEMIERAISYILINQKK